MNQLQFLKYVKNNIKLVERYRSKVENSCHNFTEEFYEIVYNYKTAKIGFLNIWCRGTTNGAYYPTFHFQFNNYKIDCDEEFDYYEDNDQIEDNHWVKLMKYIFEFFEIPFDVNLITEEIYNEYIHYPYERLHTLSI